MGTIAVRIYLHIVKIDRAAFAGVTYKVAAYQWCCIKGWRIETVGSQPVSVQHYRNFNTFRSIKSEDRITDEGFQYHLPPFDFLKASSMSHISLGMDR